MSIKKDLFFKFKEDTISSIEQKISLNPILNSFQKTVHEFNIDWDLIETFLNSMEMDLNDQIYDEEKYNLYILGSIEVVGLMCLKVFVNGDNEKYNYLKLLYNEIRQDVSKGEFLRDLNADFEGAWKDLFSRGKHIFQF